MNVIDEEMEMPGMHGQRIFEDFEEGKEEDSFEENPQQFNREEFKSFALTDPQDF